MLFRRGFPANQLKLTLIKAVLRVTFVPKSRFPYEFPQEFSLGYQEKLANEQMAPSHLFPFKVSNWGPCKEHPFLRLF